MASSDEVYANSSPTSINMDIVSTGVISNARGRILNVVTSTTYIKPELGEDYGTLVDPLEIKPDTSLVKLEEPEDVKDPLYVRTTNVRIVAPTDCFPNVKKVSLVEAQSTPSAITLHNSSSLNTCYEVAAHPSEANSRLIYSNKIPLKIEHFSTDRPLICDNMRQIPPSPLLVNKVQRQRFVKILPKPNVSFPSRPHLTSHLNQTSGQDRDLGVGKSLEREPVNQEQDQHPVLVPTLSVAEQAAAHESHYNSYINEVDEESCTSESSFKIDINEEEDSLDIKPPISNPETLTEFSSVFLPNTPFSKPFVRFSGSHNPISLKNKDIPSKFQCFACQKTFDSIFSLATHYDALNAKQPCKLSCRFCLEPFPNISRLHRHLKTHESNPSFGCGVSQCKKSYKSITKLARHIQTHVAQLLYKCTICSASFSTIDMLQFHILKDHLSYDQTVTCKICNKSLPRNRLKNHMHRHSQEKYICNFCNLSFTCGEKSKLESHILTEHIGPKSARMHKCEICKRSLNEARVKQHMEAHKAKSVDCTICSKTFTSISKLKKHAYRVHNPDTVQETCSVCKKTLKNKRGLRKHMKLHTNGKPYCTICNKRFKGDEELSAHNFNKHGYPLNVLFRDQDVYGPGQSSSQ